MNKSEYILRKKIKKVIRESYDKKINEERQLRTVIRRLLEFKYSELSLNEARLDIVDDDFIVSTKEEDEQQEEQEKEINKISDEERAVKKDTVEEDDKTGINYAVDALSRVGPSIVKKYAFLENEIDQQYYYDWMFINILLGLYRKEETMSLGDPTTDPMDAIPEEFIPVVQKHLPKKGEQGTDDAKRVSNKELPTGVKAVAPVFKEIEPQLSTFYAELTTDISQRKSFIKAIISGVRNTLDPQRVLNDLEKELTQGMEFDFID
ncbi:hypothetical protein OAT10_00115 [Luminiphilus sp.]|nr:hypothetical protein [Luminiphilus sp.]